MVICIKIYKRKGFIMLRRTFDSYEYGVADTEYLLNLGFNDIDLIGRAFEDDEKPTESITKIV